MATRFSPRWLSVVCALAGPQTYNISIGRNLILDLSETNLVAFIDDDEYPRVDWLTKLVVGCRGAVTHIFLKLWLGAARR